MSPASKAHFYRQLAKLIRSGFHLDRSVELLLSQQNDSATRTFLVLIKTGLTRGGGLTEALSDTPASTLEKAMVRAGEFSGQLEATCTHLAELFEAEATSQKAVRSALIYPLFLAHAGVLVPVLSDYLSSALTGHTYSPLHSVFIRLGVLWALMIGGWWLWRTLRTRAEDSSTADRVVRAIPWAGAVRAHWTLGRFCHVFYSTLSAGIRVADCMRMSGAAARSGLLSEASDKAALEVDQGQTLATALEKGGDAFPKVFVDSVHAAEAAGSVDLEMQRWATVETEFAISAQKKATEMLPKVLYFGVIIYVAWAIIDFFGAYYGQIMKMGNL
jgi:type II secretory pathway component PulF